jgi:hypothetical protein
LCIFGERLRVAQSSLDYGSRKKDNVVVKKAAAISRAEFRERGNAAGWQDS